MFKFLAIAIVFSLLVLVVWLKPSATLTEPVLPSSIPYNGQTRSIDVQGSAYEFNNILPERLQTSSLKGTSIDGLYPVDENGNLLLSGSIKHRFEYFLSTMGEFSLEEVQAMIRDDIELNLQEPARSQALQLFEDYVGYKYALSDLEQSLEAPQDYEMNDIQRMRLQLQQLRDKRHEYFNQETVDAFFGFDEVYDDFMLNRLEIQANTQLTSEEKAAQIKSLEQGLPEDVRNMRDETQRVSQVFQLTNDMRDEGATESEIFERNSQEFGQEAAERLQQLDNDRRVFQQQADDFMAKKKVILADDSLTNTEKQQQINAALESFDDNERRRLNALELMAKEAESLDD
jgi:lipase chaperone LimK